jgi:hypothetical protein
MFAADNGTEMHIERVTNMQVMFLKGVQQIIKRLKSVGLKEA